MSWFQTGYDGLDEKAEEKPWTDKGDRQRRVWMPSGTTQRHLFLDDDPTCYWEHGFKWNGTWKGNHEPCVVKNKLGAECPVCDSGEKMWPSYIGLHTSVNMTPWFVKKTNREVNFQQETYAAKLGSKVNPGILKKLERLKGTHGRLRGLVFDIHRTGKQSAGCGDDFTLIEKVDPKQIETYAREKLAEYAARLNQGVPEDKRITVDQLLERNPWEPINFEEQLKPRSLAELKSMFKRGSQSGEFGSDSSGGGDSGGSSDSSSGGDTKSDDFSDDDIPY